jgi:release factor glutamine methyltransferase
MLAREYLGFTIDRLKACHISMPRIVAESVLAHVCAVPRSQIECYDELNEDEISRADHLIEKVIKGTPFEYVIGKVDFYGLSLEISRKCLIPRPETELMLDFAVKECKKRGIESGVAFDVCAGSGCLGLGLKKALSGFDVVLSDIDPECAEVICHNAKRSFLDVKVVVGDFLEPLSGKADLLFCNPPYISEEEYESLSASVKDFEPKRALVAPEEGLYFYKKLAEGLSSVLKVGGLAFIEIGFSQKKAIIEIFKNSRVTILSCEKDLSGHDRFLFIQG